MFHKDDLRADARRAAAPPVIAAIAATDDEPVVGVVINTIDDTLHKQDPSSMRWTVDRLAPLRALLEDGRAAGARSSSPPTTATSSSGRRSSSVPGAAARWRADSAGRCSR